VLGEEAQGPAQEEPVGIGRDPDDEDPGLFPRRLPRETRGAIGRGQNAAGLLEEPLARGRQLRMPPGPGQETDLELALQVLNLLAQGGLRDVQPDRRASEVKLLRHCHEIPQMAKLHVPPLDRLSVSTLSEQTIGRWSAKRTDWLSGTSKPAWSRVFADSRPASHTGSGERTT
jgi:hypothetical protein